MLKKLFSLVFNRKPKSGLPKVTEYPNLPLMKLTYVNWEGKKENLYIYSNDQIGTLTHKAKRRAKKHTRIALMARVGKDMSPGSWKRIVPSFVK